MDSLVINFPEGLNEKRRSANDADQNENPQKASVNNHSHKFPIIFTLKN